MATFIDTTTMTWIAYLVFTVLAVLVAGLCTVVFLVGYSRRWIPMKGVRDEGFLTLYGEHGDEGTYEIVTGEFYEATELYLDPAREREIKLNDYEETGRKIMELRKQNPLDETAKNRLTMLVPQRIALHQNMDKSLGDCLRVHITRSLYGQKYFCIQHSNLDDLRSYAQVSRKAGLEWVLQVLGWRSRQVVKCQMDDVSPAQITNLSRFSDLPTKGEWKWIRPYKGEKMSPVERRHPPDLVVYALASQGKLTRAMNTIPTLQRQVKDAETVLHRQQEQILKVSMENHDIREGLADMGWGQIAPRREALTTTFIMALLVAVGVAGFLGFRVGAEAGGVIGAAFAAVGVAALYSSGRLERLR